MNLSIPNRVKQFFIEKKYYKKYLYKIVIEADVQGALKNSHRFGWSALFSARMALLQEITNLPIDDADYKIRSEFRFVTIFTNDAGLIELLFNNFGDKIIEYYRPVSNEHIQVLDQNRRIRVRKNLFENNFKYKVYFSHGWKRREDGYIDVKNWLEGLENASGSRWAVNKTLQEHFDHKPGYKGYTAAVYLNEPEDLMMCQISFNNEIAYIEEAVLISSL